jgi:hypothetical protein
MNELTKEERARDVGEWLAVRKEEGKRIDPATAETMWTYECVADPYGLVPPADLSDEARGVSGRCYWARSPGSDIWLLFDDLPEATVKALWARDKRELAFPAGLERSAD